MTPSPTRTSTPTATRSATFIPTPSPTPSPFGTVDLAPAADTYIQAGIEANWDHGLSDRLIVDLRRAAITYVKFDLSAVTAPVQRATLTLWCTNSSPDGGTLYPVADPSWIEGDRTGGNAGSANGPGLKWIDVDTNADGTVDTLDSSPYVPTFATPVVAIGSVKTNRAVTVDVTSAFQAGAGLYSLAIRNSSANGVTYVSGQEATVSRRPRLHLELAPPPAPFVANVQLTAAAPSSTCPGATVEADLPVSADSPTTNLGTRDQIAASGWPAKRTFLRVIVSGVRGEHVSSVRLGLTVDDLADAGSDSGGELSWIADCEWDELGATWATQPDTTDAVLLDTKGPVQPGEAVDFDITAAVAGDGVYCFVLDSASDDEVIYRASEAHVGAPEAQITIDGGCASE